MKFDGSIPGAENIAPGSGSLLEAFDAVVRFVPLLPLGLPRGFPSVITAKLASSVLLPSPAGQTCFHRELRGS